MSAKKCSYKGCNSFTNSARPTTETYYSFPKHPERLKIWMKLGGVLNEKELPYVSRYFCSKHFDETKYVASNPRRKQLLSTAIPYPCMELSSQQQIDLAIGDENEYQCVVSSVHPNVDEYDDANEEIKLHGEEISEEVTNDINCISESVETLESFEDFQNEVNCPTDFEEALEIENKRPLKRKLVHSIIKHPALQTGPPKRTISIVSNRPTSTINVFQHQQPIEEREIDEECDMINVPVEPINVTTFIFKGEEYIQMPKDEYNREKMAFMNKIRSYEEILKSVKHLMDNVKI